MVDNTCNPIGCDTLAHLAQVQDLASVLGEKFGFELYEFTLPANTDTECVITIGTASPLIYACISGSGATYFGLSPYWISTPLKITGYNDSAAYTFSRENTTLTITANPQNYRGTLKVLLIKGGW